MILPFLHLMMRSVAVVALAVSCVAVSADSAFAARKQKQRQSTPLEYGTLSGPPMLAVVSLKEQRITVYDADGNTMRARISSGSDGNETPAGTFSILQKNRDHVSNVFHVAMPFMQRLTWTGIALHEGALPGYPASHGCVRMPRSFAQRLFPMTRLGMRVVIARDNVAPSYITHAKLLQPNPLPQSVAATKIALETASVGGGAPFEPPLEKYPLRQTQYDAYKAEAGQLALKAERAEEPMQELKSLLAAKTKQRAVAAKVAKATERDKKAADDAAKRAVKALAVAMDPARLAKFQVARDKANAAVTAASVNLDKANAALAATPEAQGRARARAERAVRVAQAGKRGAEKQAALASRALASAESPASYKGQQDTADKARKTAQAAAEKHAKSVAALDKSTQDLQRTQKDLDLATAELNAAVEAAMEAERKTLPISLFVSLKTQRLYIRQGHEAVTDVPVAIADPNRPIGTHVYTAVDYADEGNTLRWKTISINRLGNDGSNRNRPSPLDVAPVPADTARASAALDRVTLPEDVMAKLRTAAWPGASLIVSDEGPSREAGPSTDHIVLLSGEPQGGLRQSTRTTPPPRRSSKYVSVFGSPFYTGNPNVKPLKVKPAKSAPKPLFGFW
jgi:hypothetical protein